MTEVDYDLQYSCTDVKMTLECFPRVSMVDFVMHLTKVNHTDALKTIQAIYNAMSQSGWDMRFWHLLQEHSFPMEKAHFVLDVTQALQFGMMITGENETLNRRLIGLMKRLFGFYMHMPSQ
jgi:hypothetical protein